MSNCIFNSNVLGFYDFCLQQIQINSEGLGRSADDIQRIIKSNRLDELCEVDLEIYKTYKHEMIHLLDSTATLWGMEYTCRMYYWFNDEKDDRLDVLLLNHSEILMHNKLLNIGESQKIDFHEIKYSLEYDLGCGVFVSLNYLNEVGELIQSTPVTMLSLLEGHAFAQEQLISTKIYSELGDIVSLHLLEGKVKESIRNLPLSEYTCLLALVYQLFPDVSLEKKFEIIILVTRFSLNSPSFCTASIPDNILNNIFPKASIELVSTLRMELCRGMHRSSMAFILLMGIFIYSKHIKKICTDTSFDEMEDILLSFYQKKGESIDFVRRRVIEYWELEFDISIKFLSECNAVLAENMARQCRNKSWYCTDFSDLSLPDFFLDSGEVIESSNRIPFDIEAYLDESLDRVSRLEKAVIKKGVLRQHLSPYVYHDWLEKIRNGDVGVFYYPD